MRNLKTTARTKEDAASEINKLGTKTTTDTDVPIYILGRYVENACL